MVGEGHSTGLRGVVWGEGCGMGAEVILQQNIFSHPHAFLTVSFLPQHSCVMLHLLLTYNACKGLHFEFLSCFSGHQDNSSSTII